MIPVGKKFRGGDRFVTPQPHEAVFRAGSSGSELPQPVTAKLVLGYDFSGIDSTVTVTGAGISEITDSSGNGNSATQSTDARRPLYGITAVNGKLVADSGGVANRHLIMPATITGFTQEGQPPYHSISVVRVTTWTNGTTAYSFQNAGSAPRNALRLSTSGGTRFEARFPAAGPSVVTLLSSETALATGTTYIVETVADSSNNGVLFVNDGTPAFALGTVDTSGEALPGRRVYDLTGAFDGLMCGFYLFDADLTAPERAEWLEFLASRWGVTL